MARLCREMLSGWRARLYSEPPSSGSVRMRLLDRPYLILLITTFFWASNTLAGRISVGHVSPMMLTSARWAATFLIMGVVAHRTFVAEWPEIRKSWRWVLVMGFIGFTWFNAFYYLACQYTTAVNLGIIQGALPIMVLMGAILVHRTPASALQWIGIVLTIVGLLLLVTRGHLEQLLGLTFDLGDIFMLLACLGYATYTVNLKGRPQVSPLTLFLGLAAVAAVTSLPLTAYEIAAGTAIWPDLTGWLLVVFIAVGPGFIAQLLFIRGVGLIGPARAGLFMNLVPVWAAIMGPLILGEVFAWYHAVALVLVLGGIAVAESGKRA